MNNTDTLARMILLAETRALMVADAGKRASLMSHVDGMTTAWEHMTGEIATNEALRAAAARVPVTA